jgi:hypothetical protein
MHWRGSDPNNFLPRRRRRFADHIGFSHDHRARRTLLDNTPREHTEEDE